MRIRKTTAILLVVAAVALTSCFKDPIVNSGNYLKASNVVLAVKNKQGDRGGIAIASNIAWQLSFENVAPDWMITNKMAGINNDSLIVTATKDNNSGGYKFANIIATPVNNFTVQPVRITVVQYDSSYKGK